MLQESNLILSLSSLPPTTYHQLNNHTQSLTHKTPTLNPQMDNVLCLCLFLSFSLLTQSVYGATFTFVNKCDYTVWPGILANAGSPSLDTTGFELREQSSRSFESPAGWSGRFWGRTGCRFDTSGSGLCQTGDCGSGQVECNGAGAAPPATLAEFTLGTGGYGSDFYDVSLVDGYNIAMIVEVSGGSGLCETTGCVNDLNQQCPSELRVDSGQGCKSACEAFGSAEYCCSGAYSTPDTCKPSVYSEMFKLACPRSYSYAYDDPTSTFTCVGADSYTLTFCPSLPSQKSSQDTSPPATKTNTTPTGGGDESGTEESGNGYGSFSDSQPETGTASNSGIGSGSGSEALEANGSWLAGLAMGSGSTRSMPFGTTLSIIIFVLLFIF